MWHCGFVANGDEHFEFRQAVGSEARNKGLRTGRNYLKEIPNRFHHPLWWLDVPNKLRKTSRHYTHLSVEMARGAYWRLRQPSVPPPIVLVGCSRAGTTVVHDTIAHSRLLKSFRHEPRLFWQDLFDPEKRGWV